ncbi:histidinol-phosphate aminotransferase [Synergistales bacterium]|nr:histidinol-phosphate aminotransferase [Synergistales bacterium]
MSDENIKDNANGSSYFESVARRNVLGIEPYMPGAQRADKEAAILSANENSFGTSRAVRDALLALLTGEAGINRYPDITCAALRDALSRKHGFPPEWFVVGNGLDDIINILALTFFEEGDEVIIPSCTFGVYESGARLMGSSPALIPMADDMSIDVDAMIGSLNHRTKAIFLCSPNNPTGTVIKRGSFERLLNAAAKLGRKPLIIADHAYMDFMDDGADYLDGERFLRDNENVVVLRTFSKVSGLAGLRVGYMIARPGIITNMYRARAPYTVNILARLAAEIDASDDEARAFREMTVRQVRESRRELEEFFEKNGVTYAPSQANFVFAFTDKSHDELRALAASLAEEGIYVRTITSQNPSGLRFSIGTPEENRRLIDAIERRAGM